MNIAISTFAGSLRPLEDEAAILAGLPALWRLLDVSVHRWAPAALAEANRYKLAEILRGLPVVSEETLAQVFETLNAHDHGSDLPRSYEAVVMSAMEARQISPYHRHSFRYLQSAAKWAAECANYAGPEARAEARALVVELSAGFKA